MTKYNPTHSDLVERAKEWLKKRKRCGVVMCEWSAKESPDAIGFTKKNSILIECKTSRNDFLSDQKKTFRKQPGRGMGDERYYMTTPGLLDLNELPKNWGLLECHANKICIKKKSNIFERKITGLKRENEMLIHALRCVVCETGHDPDWFRLGKSIKRLTNAKT
jgi:hypothetical protein